MTLHQIPGWFPANAQDWFNYLARYTASDCQIQCVLELSGHIEIEILQRAIRMSVDAEPILGCIFVEDEQHPFWKRREDLDHLEWCELWITEEPLASINEFLDKPLDFEKDAQVRCRLVRSEEKDWLCIKINHASSDGGGLKQYIRLLSDIYTRLSEDADYRPVPNVRGKRGQEAIFLEAGIINPLQAWNQEIAELKPTWAFPYRNGEPEAAGTKIVRFHPKATEQLIAYSKSKGCSINDLILTAYFSALNKLIHAAVPVESEPMDVMVTTDLRRYLPCKAEAICNQCHLIYNCGFEIKLIKNNLFR